MQKLRQFKARPKENSRLIYGEKGNECFIKLHHNQVWDVWEFADNTYTISNRFVKINLKFGKFHKLFRVVKEG